jgi:tRNA(fMet)-specific endonuclease VapC
LRTAASCLNLLASPSMNYLLDTCVVSDFVRGERRTLVHIRTVSPEDIAVSVITQMEIDYGLRINARLSRQLRPTIDAFLETVHLLPYDSAAAQKTAQLRAELKTRGAPIGAYDALIAGAALAHGLVFVTSNLQEFERIEGLILEDWRQ